MKKNRIFNIVIVLLSVVLAITLITTAASLMTYNSDYSYDADSLLYMIEDGNYADLVYEVHHNEAVGARTDADMQECYAVAKYFEAATKYKAYVQAGESERAAAQQAIMDEQEALTGELSFAVSEIDELLQISQ